MRSYCCPFYTKLFGISVVIAHGTNINHFRAIFIAEKNVMDVNWVQMTQAVI
jgi:hypothetical protein